MNRGDIYAITCRTSWWDPWHYYIGVHDIVLDGGEFLIYIGLVPKVDNNGHFVHEFSHWGRKCHLPDSTFTLYLINEWLVPQPP